MAQTIRDARLEKRSNRLKLALGDRFYKVLDNGVALCYRRTSEQFGTWSVRLVLANGRYRLEALATADDYDDANGQTILSFGQAQDAALNRFRQLEQDGGVIKSPMTVNEAAAHYMQWFRVHRKSIRETENTITAHILPTFGELTIDELKSEHIKAWLNKLASKPARKRAKLGAGIAYQAAPAGEAAKRSRKSTANRVLTVLKALLNKAYQDDHTTSNEAWTKVKPFENVDEPVVRFLKPDEATRLLNACNPDLRPFIHAALQTGTRYSELAGALVADYSRDNASLYIRPSKSGKGRHIPLTSEGCALFSAAIVGKTGNAPIFTRVDGSIWGKNYQVRPLLEACKNASIEPAIGFHELRHTYASLLAQAGADLLTISKLLGHADTRITSRHYAHLCDKTLANAVNRFLPSFGEPKSSNVTTMKTQRAKQA